MALKLIAYSADLGNIRRLIVWYEDINMISILSADDNWNIPRKTNGHWHPYWIVHSAVNKQEF